MINAQDHRLWAHYRIISGDLGLSSRGSSNRRASTTSTANILSECAWDCLIDATQNSVYCVSDDISCLCEDFSARQVALNCIEDLCSTSDTTTFEEYMDKCGARPSGGIQRGNTSTITSSSSTGGATTSPARSSSSTTSYRQPSTTNGISATPTGVASPSLSRGSQSFGTSSGASLPRPFSTSSIAAGSARSPSSGAPESAISASSGLSETGPSPLSNPTSPTAFSADTSSLALGSGTPAAVSAFSTPSASASHHHPATTVIFLSAALGSLFIMIVAISATVLYIRWRRNGGRRLSSLERHLPGDGEDNIDSRGQGEHSNENLSATDEDVVIRSARVLPAMVPNRLSTPLPLDYVIHIRPDTPRGPDNEASSYAPAASSPRSRRSACFIPSGDTLMSIEPNQRVDSTVDVAHQDLSPRVDLLRETAVDDAVLPRTMPLLHHRCRVTLQRSSLSQATMATYAYSSSERLVSPASDHRDADGTKTAATPQNPGPEAIPDPTPPPPEPTPTGSPLPSPLPGGGSGQAWRGETFQIERQLSREQPQPHFVAVLMELQDAEDDLPPPYRPRPQSESLVQPPSEGLNQSGVLLA